MTGKHKFRELSKHAPNKAIRYLPKAVSLFPLFFLYPINLPLGRAVLSLLQELLSTVDSCAG